MKPNILRTILLLVFVDLALLMNYIRKPHFILTGLFFFDSVFATVIALLLMFLCILIGIQLYRLKKSVYKLSLFYTRILLWNSIITLAFAVFIYDDMAGFLLRIFGANVFFGFILQQLMFVLVNYWLFIALSGARKYFRY